MTEHKEIRFTEKKVDESWKDQTARDKDPRDSPRAQTTSKAGASEAVTSKIILNFLTSLGLQAMIHLGEIPNPENNAKEKNLEGAREIIDLLIHLKNKMQGNLSAEESEFFNTLLPELQIKFSQMI